ncbi:MAG: hypothetical protein A2168_04330 [Planctomycetes bacterium RBG_13_50_24]|nr:MAG: hypothetical protein A2168_04330 [Planctomycetes bacterium RBG_13_50_24]
MNPNKDNLSSDDSVTQLDKNFSRLLKLTGESKKPGRIFTESLINGALDELKQPEAEKAEAKHIRIRSGWLEKVVGWAAMIAVACGAGLVIVISAFLKMNLLLEIVVVLTIVFNWLNYLGGRI